MKAVLIGFILALLLSATQAGAQGNDFPFSPGIEPWSQPFLPTPDQAHDYTTGRAYGPIQLNAPAGSHVIVDFVLDWWNLGPLLTSLVSDGAANMRWVGPDTEQGEWRGWCLRCTWEFDTTVDNASLWLDYIGTSGFGAHLEVRDITAPASAVKKEVKDKAREQAQRANNYADILNTYAAISATKGQGFTALVLAIGAILEGRYARGQDAIASAPDPAGSCDYNVGVADYSNLKISEDSTLGYYNNRAVELASIIDGWGAYVYNQAINGCADTAKWGLVNMGANLPNLGYLFQRIADNLEDNPTTYQQVCDAAGWQYLAENPDVAGDSYYGQNPDTAWQHYVDYGQYEGRVWRSDYCPAAGSASQTLYQIGDDAWNYGQFLMGQ